MTARVTNFLARDRVLPIIVPFRSRPATVAHPDDRVGTFPSGKRRSAMRHEGFSREMQIDRRVAEVEVIPFLRTRGDWRVFHLRGVFENSDLAGDRDAHGVKRTPDHGQELVFVETGNRSKTLAGQGKLEFGDQRGGFVGKGSVDERIFPGEMPLIQPPTTVENFPSCRLKRPSLPRRDAQRIFVRPPLRAEIGGIETGIDPRLDKEINIAAPSSHRETD